MNEWWERERKEQREGKRERREKEKKGKEISSRIIYSTGSPER